MRREGEERKRGERARGEDGEKDEEATITYVNCSVKCLNSPSSDPFATAAGSLAEHGAQGLSVPSALEAGGGGGGGCGAAAASAAAISAGGSHVLKG